MFIILFLSVSHLNKLIIDVPVNITILEHRCLSGSAKIL